MQKLVSTLAVISVGVLALPAFASAAFDYTYARTPSGDTVTNPIYASVTVTDDTDCSFVDGGITKAGIVVSRFGGGENFGGYVPYTVNVPFVASASGLALSSDLDDPDGQYTGITLRLSNEAEDSTCNKTLESSSYPARLFTLIAGTTTPPGGGGGDSEMVPFEDLITEYVATTGFIIATALPKILLLLSGLLCLVLAIRYVRRNIR